jgi:hypothetical protein
MANEFVAKNGLISQNNSVVNGSLTVIGNQTITGSLIQGLPGNIATGDQSHAEGSITQAIGNYSHAEGDNTRAKGDYSHAEGQETISSGSYSHAEGYSTIAIGTRSHAEGETTLAIGDVSHAEGFQTISSGSYSHAEGKDTQAIGNYSHAEGDSTIARGGASHAEGLLTLALGLNSHAEGLLTTASANYSHAEGQQTQAIGEASHAEGLGTVASANYQHVQGQYNISSPVQSAFIIGNGVDGNNRSNLVFAAGSAFQVTGSLNVTAGITGSLQGTASWANNSTTASYILNAISSSFSATASLAPNYLLLSSTASMLAPYVLNSQTGSFTRLATGSVTASVSPSQFTISSGSSTELTVTGTGVTMGNVITDTHRVTGSFSVSGSITATSFSIPTSSMYGSNLPYVAYRLPAAVTFPTSSTTTLNLVLISTASLVEGQMVLVQGFVSLAASSSNRTLTAFWNDGPNGQTTTYVNTATNGHFGFMARITSAGVRFPRTVMYGSTNQSVAAYGFVSSSCKIQLQAVNLASSFILEHATVTIQ